MSDDITIKIATTTPDFDLGKTLFKEYAQSLGVDLSFQDFESELQTIAQQYNKPDGALLLIFKGQEAIGCAGIRKLENHTAELKRMYLQDAYRGQGIGLTLLTRSIETAKTLGYHTIRLDTLRNMTAAQQLYKSFGFYEIPAYRFNPLEGTIYMEKEL